MKYYVHVEKSAIAQILLNGFEAFVINHAKKKRNGLEMHASLYGFSEETSRTLHHYVEFVSVDTSAEMMGGYVVYDRDAQALKSNLAKELGYKFIGAMHTHPYLLAEEKCSLEFVREEGCDFSLGDLNSFHQILLNMSASGVGNPELVELLLTIKQIERENMQKDGFTSDEKHTFEFAVGNCKCFLRAQVFGLDQNHRIQMLPTELKCEYLEKFHYVAANFGRVRVAEGKQRIVEYKSQD